MLGRYLPVINLTLTFFQQHHKNRTDTGQYVIWPTQALETYVAVPIQRAAPGRAEPRAVPSRSEECLAVLSRVEPC